MTWRVALVLLLFSAQRDGNQLLRTHTHKHARAHAHTRHAPLTSVDTVPSTQSGSARPMGAGECWRGRAAHDTPLFGLAVTDPLHTSSLPQSAPLPFWLPSHTHSSKKKKKKKRTGGPPERVKLIRETLVGLIPRFSFRFSKSEPLQQKVVEHRDTSS